MGTVNLNDHVLDFYKNATKTSFDVLDSFTVKFSAFTDSLLKTVPSFPEGGKKSVSIYFEGSQKGLAILRKYVESHLDLDWTPKDTPVKCLETLEAFNKDAIRQAAEIQEEILYIKESQKGLAILKKYLECQQELDWRAKDAPVKTLEEMEAFSNDGIKEAAEIKKR